MNVHHDSGFIGSQEEEELHTDGLSERDDDLLTGSVERKAADDPDDPVHPDLQLHPDPTATCRKKREEHGTHK